jgi:hypothetical protein
MLENEHYEVLVIGSGESGKWMTLCTLGHDGVALRGWKDC